MDRTFDNWLDGAPMVDIALDNAFTVWLDNAPVLNVYDSHLILIGMSATFAGSTVLSGYLSKVGYFSAHFIMFTTFTADMMVVPYGEAEDSPPYTLPDVQFERSVLPPMSGSFTRPFGISQRIRTCRAVTCCEDEAVVPAYSSTKKFVKTYVAVGFYSERPLMGQESFNLSPTDYALADEDTMKTAHQNLETVSVKAQRGAFDTATDNTTINPDMQTPADGNTPADEIANEGQGEGPLESPPVPYVPLSPVAEPLLDTLNLYKSILALNPSFHPGSSQFNAELDPQGRDTQLGFPFQLNSTGGALSFLLKTIDIHIAEGIPGASATLYLFKSAKIGSSPNYWYPAWDALPEATFTLSSLLSRPSGSYSSPYYDVRFTRLSGAFTLQADTPYVLMLDLIPNVQNMGTYAWATLIDFYSFATTIGSRTPGADALMPPFTLRRLYYPPSPGFPNGASIWTQLSSTIERFIVSLYST